MPPSFISSLGMQGTGSWSSNEVPENYRQLLLQIAPNGGMPITGITSKMPSEPTDNAHFYWNEKPMPIQSVSSIAASSVFTNIGLSTAYVSGAVAGSVLYIKLAAAQLVHFVTGQEVLMRAVATPALDTVGKIISRVENGANSFIAVKLLEADDNGGSTYLASLDTIDVIGTINAQGATRPEAISYKATSRNNVTQIFRTPLSVTRTAKMTKLRTGDVLTQMRKEALLIHGMQMEQAFIHGVFDDSSIGSNGEPEYATRGIRSFIKSYASENVFNYVSDSAFSGQAFRVGGEEWLENCLESVFKYGSTEKLAIVGNGVLKAITQLAKLGASITIQPGELAYGIKIMRWITPYGELLMKSHPLMNVSSIDRSRMIVVEPKYLRYRHITDTTFIGVDEIKGNTGQDGFTEEYITEAGLEVHYPETMALLDGFGMANTA